MEKGEGEPWATANSSSHTADDAGENVGVGVGVVGDDAPDGLIAAEAVTSGDDVSVGEAVGGIDAWGPASTK